MIISGYRIWGVVAATLVVAGVLYMPRSGASLAWERPITEEQVAQVVAEPPRPTHIETPNPVKALYMSSWVAGTPSIRERVVRLIDETEANAVVIDIKDYSGKIAFEVDDPKLRAVGAAEPRIRDMREFIRELHEKNIYVIGRIAVFQDAYLTKTRPDLALRREGTDEVWTDKHKLGWLDAGSREVWDYVVAIGKEAWNQGFDELNYDYIRFPSDGDTNTLAYRFYNPATLTKHEQIAQFFQYLNEQLSDIPAPISADLFGMTTSNTDDLGIGQLLEDAIPHFDYIAPMIYPSHYPPNWNNIKNPNASPYTVIKLAMEAGIERVEAASSTRSKFRPWLQDFSLYGVSYGEREVRDQIRALNELGITSWMMWDPKNKYTPSAYSQQ